MKLEKRYFAKVEHIFTVLLFGSSFSSFTTCCLFMNSVSAARLAAAAAAATAAVFEAEVATGDDLVAVGEDLEAVTRPPLEAAAVGVLLLLVPVAC